MTVVISILNTNQRNVALLYKTIIICNIFKFQVKGHENPFFKKTTLCTIYGEELCFNIQNLHSYDLIR